MSEQTKQNENQTPAIGEVLSLRQVAALACISYSGAFAAMQKGRLKAFRIDSGLFVTRADAEEFAKERPRRGRPRKAGQK
jgi:hypothetical protein